ncbi:hypothetical protein ES319_D02G096600v1 [Gossypium barbadense]|uniref:Uncharacterized protein n=1 Tax=Gossypium barbadense TaxID=3634 RepID=A0A5J5SCL7_GOSBA|nr:hypothetical protein ES319_D02G096600v1 [Gossypium barbadense]
MKKNFCVHTQIHMFFLHYFFYLYLPLKRLNIIDDLIKHTSFACDFVTSWYKSCRYFILSLIFSLLTYINQHN